MRVRNYLTPIHRQESKPYNVTKKVWNLVKKDAQDLNSQFNTSPKLGKVLVTIKATRLVAETILALIISITFTLPLDGIVKIGRGFIQLTKNISKKLIIPPSKPSSKKEMIMRMSKCYAPYAAALLGALGLSYLGFSYIGYRSTITPLVPDEPSYLSSKIQILFALILGGIHYYLEQPTNSFQVSLNVDYPG